MKRREFLKFSTVGVSFIASSGSLLANSKIDTQKYTLQTYRDEIEFLSKDRAFSTIDGSSWLVELHDGVVTKEAQYALYPQVNLKIPDFNPKGCNKGAQHSQSMYEKDRLLYPMKREKDGWKRVSWNEAVEEIALKIWEYIKDEREKIAVYEGKGFLAEGRAMACSRFASFLKAFKIESSYKKDDTPYESLYGADTIILWGTNPNVTKISDAHFIWESKYNGAKVIVITPEFNSTAKFADIWVPIRVGSDDILAKAILKEMPKDDVLEFEGYEEKLENFSLEEVEKKTGVHLDTIKELAKEITSSNRVKIIANENLKSSWSISFLSFLVGCYREVDDKKRLESIECNPKIVDKNLEELDTKMAFMVASNELKNMTQDGKKEFLNRLDCLVCIDTKMSETAYFADFVLPAKSRYEVWDIGLSSLESGFITLSRPFRKIERVGEAKDEWRIFALILKKLESMASENENENFTKVYRDFINESGEFKLRTDKEAVVAILNEIGYKVDDVDSLNGILKFDFQKKATCRDIFSDKKEIFEDKEEEREDEVYKLKMIVTKSRWSINSCYNTSRTLLRLQRGKPYIQINRKMAVEKGIKDADEVRVYNDMGEFYAMAKLSSSSPFDVVIMQNSWESYMFKNKQSFVQVGCAKKDDLKAISVDIKRVEK